MERIENSHALATKRAWSSNSMYSHISRARIRFRAISVAAVMLVVFPILGPAAFASAQSLSESDRAFVVAASERLGMSPAARDSLIAKLERGALPDSMTGASPDRTTTRDIEGATVVRKEFPDGSVAQTTFGIPNSSRQTSSRNNVPMSVAGCVDYAGAGRYYYSNCRVRTDQATFTMEYQANGYLGTNCSRWPAQITAIYGTWYTGIGSASSPWNEVLRSTEGCGNAASARGNVQVTINAGPLSYSYTVSLTFYVQGTSRWDTSP